jgi:hypothetical protein
MADEIQPGEGQEGPTGATAFDGAGAGAGDGATVPSAPPPPLPPPSAPTEVAPEAAGVDGGAAEQFRVLEQRLGAIEKNTASPEAPPKDTRAEMLRLLAEADGEVGLPQEQQQQQQYQQQQQQYPDQQQPAYQDQQQPGAGQPNEALVNRLAQVEDLLLAQEEESRYNSLSQLAGDNSDFLADEANMKAVTNTVSRFADKYGESMLKSDPELVSLAIRAEQAKIARAGEVPADQARNSGAALETQAGTSGGGELNTEEEIKRAIFSTVEGAKDTFTGG